MMWCPFTASKENYYNHYYAIIIVEIHFLTFTSNSFTNVHIDCAFAHISVRQLIQSIFLWLHIIEAAQQQKKTNTNNKKNTLIAPIIPVPFRSLKTIRAQCVPHSFQFFFSSLFIMELEAHSIVRKHQKEMKMIEKHGRRGSHFEIIFSFVSHQNVNSNNNFSFAIEKMNE